MPLITMYNVTDTDIESNPECLFIYADHRKQTGKPYLNNKFRRLERAFPLILKKRGGTDPIAYWKNSEFELFLNEYAPSLQKIVDVLRRGCVGILCAESLHDDEFLPTTLKEHSPDIHEYVGTSLHSFYSEFSPKKLRLQ